MIISHTPGWIWLLALLFGSPWLAGSIVLWRFNARERTIPPSFADLWLRR